MSFFDEVDGVDETCDALAEAFCEMAAETMLGMCGNDGQLSIILDCLDQVLEQVDDVSEGEFSEIESSHPEAVGDITDTGTAILETGAEICQEIRDAADELTGGDFDF